MPAEWTPDRTPDVYRTPGRAKAALARADAMVAAVMAENAMLRARVNQLEEMHEGLLRRFVDPHRGTPPRSIRRRPCVTLGHGLFLPA